MIFKGINIRNNVYVIEEMKERQINNVLYIASAVAHSSKDKWQQITDSWEVTCWTSGDWDDYYFVFEYARGKQGQMRMETIALQDKTYVNLFKPDKLTSCGKIIWSCIMRTECEKLSLSELEDVLAKYSINLKDTSVYSAKKGYSEDLKDDSFVSSSNADSRIFFKMPPVLPKKNNEIKQKKFEYTYKKATGYFEDIFNMSYELIKVRHECGDSRFTVEAIDEYVGKLYHGPFKDFEDNFVQMLINYYNDMPYGILVDLKEYIKHNENPLCPKECIGTALVQAFVKFDYIDLHNKQYEGHI